MPDLPIACTLTPGGMTARLALIEQRRAKTMRSTMPRGAKV